MSTQAAVDRFNRRERRLEQLRRGGLGSPDLLIPVQSYGAAPVPPELRTGRASLVFTFEHAYDPTGLLNFLVIVNTGEEQENGFKVSFSFPLLPDNPDTTFGLELYNDGNTEGFISRSDAVIPRFGRHTWVIGFDPAHPVVESGVPHTRVRLIVLLDGIVMGDVLGATLDPASQAWSEAAWDGSITPDRIFGTGFVAPYEYHSRFPAGY